MDHGCIWLGEKRGEKMVGHGHFFFELVKI